eukprot:TRINITY_DN26344_c0_g1_i1.p2 TRINITY_DN26344_c0_g1~~TRINITY_DN26344_c0_g1_i1.p2  ORF type:complete len:290 (-),score=69.25 TRINITY_DN26344_c0_g1_i1:425-1294(-)
MQARIASPINSGVRCKLVQHVLKRGTRVNRVKAEDPQKTPMNMNTEEMKKMQEEMMKDPAMAAKIQQMEEAMKSPEMQAQQQQMMSAMNSEEMQKKIANLQSDPEFADLFKELEASGPQAIFKYWNDPKMLAKLGEKMGDIAPALAQQTAPQIPSQRPPVEINTLLDAAKYGDIEAIEDFIAIGKDVNMRDGEGRTPLHYTVAYNHAEAAELMLYGGADINLVDNRNNTPLHYACGYARNEIISLLLTRKPDLEIKNEADKTPFDLINDEPRNPINQDNDLMRQLAGSD